MGDNIQELNRIFRDQHGITVNVIRFERDTQLSDIPPSGLRVGMCQPADYLPDPFY